MHLGQHIRDFIESRGISVSWLASEICCSRTNIYKIFERQSLDTDLVMRLSRALHHDFFKDLSENL